MATFPNTSESERQRLEQAISTLEAQRAILGDAAANAAIASLRRELSALGAPETETGPRKEGERRIVTILFSDVVGSTAIAEGMDPEEWTEIMNDAFKRLIEPVERYGGTVARLMGDAILAFFGAPIAHEDDPQRAVLAGLAIIEGFHPFREKLRQERGLDFNVRVGINTGLAVVGDVGSETAGEYTAMGDAVNLAARMESTAEAGTVQIAEDTYAQVSPLFEFEELGGIPVKGKRLPVQAYKVVGRKSSPGRIRGIKGLDAPLVGRGSEMALLSEFLSACDLDGSGAIVCLTGEAGLGKSRLIRELRSSAPSTYQWYETASLSFESGQPYSLFQRLIRRLAGLAAGDPAARLREGLGGLVQLFPADEREEIGRLFEALFGLSGGPGGPAPEGEAFKRRLFTAMTDLCQELLRRGPLVLVCDDLHWTDPASAELLGHLLSLVERGPLLILLSMRPDTQTPGWGVKETAEKNFGHRFTIIQVKPLTSEEGGQLVDSLLAISDLPPQLRAIIQEKTEGNPFFLEEVVRALIEEGMVIRDEDGRHWRATGDGGEIHIPDNVQALLMARIDRLEESARKTLQMASVVGRTFYYRVLAYVVDLVDELGAQLLTLQQTQFIQEAARVPDLEYIFRHALTQEAAYSAILRRQRQIYHRRVGEALESLFSDRQEEFAVSLAFHFFQAGDFRRGLQYYTLAGDASYRLFASVEAIEHYSRAIECAAKVDEVSGEQLIHLYIRRGRAYKLENRFQEALDNYQVMIELARERGDKALRLASLTAQCILRAGPNPLHDLPQARALAEKALPLARELGARSEEARVLFGLLLVTFQDGDYEASLSYGRQSLAIARELGLTQQVGYALHYLSAVLYFLERNEEAQRMNLEERAAWLETGNTPMLADCYLNSAGLYLYGGDYQAALVDGKEALRIARSINLKAIEGVAPYYIGLTLLEKGDVEQAQEQLQRGLNMAVQERRPWFINAGYTHLIHLNLSVGALERAEPLAKELLQNRDHLIFGTRSLGMGRVARLKLAQGDLLQAEKAHAGSFREGEADSAPLMTAAEALIAGVLLHLAQGRPEEALSEASQLVERTRRADMKTFLTEALLVQGQALAALQELDRATTVLSEGVQIAEEIGQRRLLWQILAELAVIEARRGDAVAAQNSRGRAREVIGYIADHAGDGELRESFLAMPLVKRVMDG